MLKLFRAHELRSSAAEHNGQRVIVLHWTRFTVLHAVPVTVHSFTITLQTVKLCSSTSRKGVRLRAGQRARHLLPIFYD